MQGARVAIPLASLIDAHDISCYAAIQHIFRAPGRARMYLLCKQVKIKNALHGVLWPRERTLVDILTRNRSVVGGDDNTPGRMRKLIT